MDNKAELLRLLRLAWAADHVSAADCKKIDALLAAPAEDVHAVGEEPVYQVCNGVSGWIDVDLLRYTACQLDPEEYETRMLFVRPQRPVDSLCSEVSPLCSEHLRTQGRPVVLPERVDETQYRGSSIFGVRRWNAYIAEFERLNK